MADRILICGPGDDEPDYDGLNSPSGRCSEHGDYLYFCRDCAIRVLGSDPFDGRTDGGDRG